MAWYNESKNILRIQIKELKKIVDILADRLATEQKNYKALEKGIDDQQVNYEQMLLDAGDALQKVMCANLMLQTSIEERDKQLDSCIDMIQQQGLQLELFMNEIKERDEQLVEFLNEMKLHADGCLMPLPYFGEKNTPLDEDVSPTER